MAGKHVAMVLSNGPLAGQSPSTSAQNGGTTTTKSGGIKRIREASGVEIPYVLAVNNVRVRTEPSTKASSLGYIAKGTKVAYGDTDPDTGWHAVDTSEGPGFVSGKANLTKLVTS